MNNPFELDSIESNHTLNPEYFNYHSFMETISQQTRDIPEGLTRQMASVYESMRPLQIEEAQELIEKFSIDPDVFHVLAMQQSGISAPANIIDWEKTNTFLFPSLPDIEAHPVERNAPWALKSYFSAPDDKTPYRIENREGKLIITFHGKDTGIEARPSELKALRYNYGSNYLYTNIPASVTLNPIDANCGEACTFCPVAYRKKTSAYGSEDLRQGNLIPPEKLIQYMLTESSLPSMNMIDRLAIISAKFPDNLPEHLTYPAYIAEIAKLLEKHGFSGELFMLADLSTQNIDTFVKYYQSSIRTIYAHTLEVFDDGIRKFLMPGKKGNTNAAKAYEAVIKAKDVYTKVGFFYIAGLENTETTYKFLDKTAKVEGIYPWMHALNSYAPGIMKRLAYQNIFQRLEMLLEAQKALIERFGIIYSYNLYSLIPHGAELDAENRLVYPKK